MSVAGHVTRTVVMVVVLVVGVVGGAGVSAASGSGASQASAGSVAVVWPGDGRMLSAPLVVGGNVIGEGSLEMVGDTITTNTANFDAAPPELSLRLFTFVPNNDGGFSAILRFRVPIVVLHSWRGNTVRQTMTVIVTPPSGAARAVQMRVDGTTANGSFAGGAFSPAEAGNAVISGNVAVFDIPASFGVSSDWTVQAIVKVQADAPLRPNRPATGYAAGTSIVPVGLLTGASAPSTGWGVVDATTALTTAASGPAGTKGLRPQAVRFEGQGKELVAVVTLDGSPSQVPASDNPHLDLDLAPPGFATLEHPLRVTWLPNGPEPVTSARVSIDTIAIGDVPVTVSGNDVRFALGAEVARSSIAAPSTPRLDAMTYQATVSQGRYEAVNSPDGISGPPAQSDSDTADLTVNGRQITVTAASTGIAATGVIDAAGRFVAFNQTDLYAGSVDAAGNVVIYRTTLTETAAGGRSVSRPVGAATKVPVTGDLRTTDSKPSNVRRVNDAMKHAAGDPAPQLSQDPPFEDNPWVPLVELGPSPQNLTVGVAPADGPAEPAGAQGGNPDWPDTPTVTTGSANSGNTARFAARVTGGTTPSGNPIDVTTPWVVSTLLAGPVGATNSPTGVARTASKGAGPSVAIAVVVAAVVVIGGAGLLAIRRRRARPGNPPSSRDG